MSTPTPNAPTTMTAQRPHSTLLPTMTTSASPRKRPTSLAGTTASPIIKGRQVLGNITVQSFQDRHRTEFAHLHTHSDDSLREKRLEAEKWELEEARRLGKEKRESLKAEAAAKVAAAEAGRKMDGKGRRPLSLVVKRSAGSRPNSTSLSAPNANVHSKSERPVSAPLAPISALVSPRTSAGLGLDVVVENESGNTSFLPSTATAYATATSTPTGEEEPSPDTSISQSSYSWASQFSGETEDLRIAARYVPKPRVHNHSAGGSHEDDEQEGQEELDDEEDDEEVLASPNEDGTVRRRKKIVALAHTVRQLEGVGSREAEDPEFYATLVKAWNERPVAGGGGNGNGSEASPYAATVSSDNGSSPYTPNLSSRHSDSHAHSYSHSKDDASSFHSNCTGTGATRRSNSVRYSYASTLHDLAMEGGIEQANRIFLAKPWLRGSVVSATPNATGGADGAGEKEDAFGSNFARPPSSQAPQPRAQDSVQEGAKSESESTERRLSLGSSPPALAPPIDLASGSVGHGLRKAKGSIADLDASKSSANAESDSAATTVPAASSWGLGFVNDWFATPTAPAAASAAPTTEAQALPRSTTVAQFDDAPNDNSADVDDVDAEGETDYDFESAVEHEQGFHEGEGGQDHLDPELRDEQGEGEGIRPESSLLAMPSQDQESAKAQSAVNQDQSTKSVASKSITDSVSSSSLTELAYAQDRPNSHMDMDPTSLPLPPTPTLTQVGIPVNGSPSSNPSRPLICSTHLITSYQPQLVHHQGLGLDTQVEGQTAIIEEGSLEEINLTTRDSYLSSDSYSSPLKSLTTGTETTTKTTKEKPVLAPIQTRRGLNLNLNLGSDSNLPLDANASTASTDAEGHPLRHHLSDPRFSNAYKLAQSLRVPTPTIKSPTRQSSINVLSTLLSPTSASAAPSALTSPTLSQVSTPDMQVSSRWFSQDSSEVETMMGGAPSVSPSMSTSGRQSVQGPGRARSSTLLASSPGALSPTSPNIVGNGNGAGTKTLRRPSRPNLLDTRAATLSSISESALGNGLHPSDIPNSISGGSEILSDNDNVSGLTVDVSGHPLDSPSMMSDLDTDSEFDFPPSTRRSRLAKSSLDSLPSYMRPPSISDSLSPSASASTAERRTSNYQVYQQRQAERSKRANARVAAKMSGATPQEMKKLERIQHQSMILGPLSSNNGNFNLGQLETASMMVVPEPSKMACALFFLGFLGPWFWIFGGWMPLGHSSEVRKDEDTSLDFTAADHLPRWWRWTYHPDPWVKRNRRAAAVGVPVLVVGGIAAAIAVALVMGAA